MSGSKRKRAKRTVSRGAAKARRLGGSVARRIRWPSRAWRKRIGRYVARLSPRSRWLALPPLIALSLGALAFVSLLIAYTIMIPDPLSLRTAASGQAIRILARDGTVIAERGAAHDYIPLDLLPKRVIDAVIATEDRRFWDHWGIDPAGFARAALVNLRAGRFAQGGSTLTQQLAKNLFLSSERTIGRKIEEVALAFWLELRLSKNEILELYLNRVYFGGGAYGIEAAAQRYFDKSARALTLAEAAVIAGLLKAPSRYAPTSNPRLAVLRAHSVLAKMHDAGFITAAEEQLARSKRLVFANVRRDSEKNATDYAIDYVLERMPDALAGGQGEIVVDTTIDRDMQRHATAVVAEVMSEQGAVLAANQAAMIVLDTSGGIRAMVGGRSYAESQFNRAVKAVRQPGSAFKPFVYLAALQKGYRPDSVAYDLPFNLEGWSPKNDNGRFSGAVTLRQALAQSINTVAVRLMMDVGPQKVVALATRLGIEAPLRSEPSLALGTSEVSLLDLTGAYGKFAAGGTAIEPYVIRRIRSGRGRVLYARPAPASELVADPAAIASLNGMLQTVVSSGTGKRAALADHPTAGKTGTSQDFRDAWFIGYTSHFAAGVWVGNDNGEPMRRVTGGNLPAQIWNRVMEQAHRGKESLPLPGTEWKEPEDGITAADADRPVAPPPELLPWQMPTKVPPSAKPLKVKPEKRAEPSRYPANRIDEDFIARVLSDLPAEPPMQTLTSEMTAPELSAPRQPSTPRRPAPLPGLMSLGAGLSRLNP
jgi:penicillin-binding protein 1A